MRYLGGAVGGLFFGLGLMVAALWPYGAGDGWTAPFVVSIFSLILLPITGLIVSIPYSRNKTIYLQKINTARLFLMLMIILDALLVVFTVAYDADVFIRDWLLCLLIGIPWEVLWILWHYVVISIAMEKTIRL